MEMEEDWFGQQLAAPLLIAFIFSLRSPGTVRVTNSCVFYPPFLSRGDSGTSLHYKIIIPRFGPEYLSYPHNFLNARWSFGKRGDVTREKVSQKFNGRQQARPLPPQQKPKNVW